MNGAQTVVSERETRLYIPQEAEIVGIYDLTPHEKLFRLRLLSGLPLGHQPGQFLQVSLLGLGEAPISVASSSGRGEIFELGVRRAGTLTGAMHQLGVGSRIGIRGPFGRGFELESLRGRDLLLISGGCGLAPLRSLIQYCDDNPDEFGKIVILYGAKSQTDILFKDELDLWAASARFTCCRTVDNVSGGDCYSGNVGLITSLIPPLELKPDNTVAVVIGPPAMYRAVIGELQKKRMKSDRIVVSLERQMRCGVGKCGHCSIEHLYCCKDGPVFWLHEIEHLRGAL